jgi:hypothetical protein
MKVPNQVASPIVIVCQSLLDLLQICKFMILKRSVVSDLHMSLRN